ncbi:MAG TPA: IS110 family transposase [Clostridiales bacterium]|jgi:transposase|nr:IS110 family transposase [Clostridiales bacterium]
MSDSIFIGIDVSTKSNKVCILDQQGNRLAKLSVDNNSVGSDRIVKRAIEALNKTNCSNVSFGLEATSVYGDGLIFFLKQEPSLKPYNTKVFLLNPKQVHNFKKAYSDLPKTDDVDAWVIADCLRFGRINLRETYFDEHHKALQRLTRARYFVAQNIVREKNRYLTNLFLKFSGMCQEKLFSNNLGTTAMELSGNAFSLDEIVQMPVDELAAFINTTGKGKFVDPETLAAEVQKAARSSYRLPKTVEDSINRVLAVSVISIQSYSHQLKTLDKSISTLMETIPNTLTSIKGIGPVYSAGILSEIGSINRFKDQASLAKYAGLSWSRYQSGNFDADNTHLINSGNRYLRYYLIEAANLARRHDPELKSFYELKYRETPKTPHKRALALTARKFVRLVYALLRDQRLYSPPRVR